MSSDEAAQLLPILQALGMSTQESSVYMACVNLGTRPASTIADKSSVKRSHVYNILGQLIEKGFAYECTKNGVRHFGANSLQAIAAAVDEKKRTLEQHKKDLLDLIPRISKPENGLLAKGQVKFFRGIEGIKTIFEDTLSLENDTILGLLDFEACAPYAWEGFETFINDYVLRRAEQNLTYEGIAVKTPSMDAALASRVNKKRIMRYIENASIPVELLIYGEKVAIICHLDRSGLIIESPHIALAARTLFRMAWVALPIYEFTSTAEQ